MDEDSFLHVVDLGCAYELRLTNINGENQMIDRMWRLAEGFEAVK